MSELKPFSNEAGEWKLANNNSFIFLLFVSADGRYRRERSIASRLITDFSFQFKFSFAKVLKIINSHQPECTAVFFFHLDAFDIGGRLFGSWLSGQFCVYDKWKLMLPSLAAMRSFAFMTSRDEYSGIFR